MDHTEALPDDALAGILGRLQSRDLAVSRCVRRAWRTLVDDRRLLLPHLLPHSVEGIFANFASSHLDLSHRPHFLARPSTQHPGVDYGNLHFLPCYTGNKYRPSTIADHCNGLLLHDSKWEFSVVNPATRRWQRLPRKPAHGEGSTAYLAFDPSESPQKYEVFLIPPKDLGLFDVTDCQSASVSPELLMEENFTVTWSFFSKVAWTVEVSPHSTVWPPPVLALQVFSSSTGEWRERSFVREGKAMARVVNVRTELYFMRRLISRWRYSTCCHEALHVLLSYGAFVMRFSLSNGTYRVINTPIDAKERKIGEQYLGRLGKDVMFAKLLDRIRIWTLSESSGNQVGWVLKNDIDLAPLENIPSLQPKVICKRWILDHNHDLDEYGNNKVLAGQTFDWNSDDDNVLDTNDECGLRRQGIQLIGFHPYKEIAFFLVNLFGAVAYHLDSSKVQYVGDLRIEDKLILKTTRSFLYTPCMMGDLPETANGVEN